MSDDKICSATINSADNDIVIKEMLVALEACENGLTIKKIKEYFDEPSEQTAFILGAVVSFRKLSPTSILKKLPVPIGDQLRCHSLQYNIGFYLVKLLQAAGIMIVAILGEMGITWIR